MKFLVNATDQEGVVWAVDVQAISFEDAKNKVKREYPQYDCEVLGFAMHTIDMITGENIVDPMWN